MGFLTKMRGFCFQKDENPARGNWACRFDYFFILLGLYMSPSMGNILMYFCSRNGIPYLIPFFLALVVLGIPLVTLETYLGQFSNSGELTCWRFASVFQGIGFAKLVMLLPMIIINGIVTSLYLYYMAVSFSGTRLAWTDCDPEWTKAPCFSFEDFSKANCTTNGGTPQNCWNESIIGNGPAEWTAFPSHQYFSSVVYGHEEKTLDMYDEPGSVRWGIAISCLVVYTLTFLILSGSVKSYGKAAYITSILPIILGIYLLAEGLSLPGHEIGTRKLLSTDTFSADLERLLADSGLPTRIAGHYPSSLFSLEEKDLTSKPQDLNKERLPEWTSIWNRGALNVYNGFVLCQGVFSTLGSYNHRKTNFFWDLLLAVVCGLGLLFLYGYAQFAFLGHLSFLYGIPDVSTGFQYIQISDMAHVFTIIPRGSTIARAYYLMLFLRNFNFQLAGAEALRTAIVDVLQRLQRFKIVVLLAICVSMFLLSLPQLTDNGRLLSRVVDFSILLWPIYLIPLFQCLAVVYFYGAVTGDPLRILHDVRLMIGQAWVVVPLVWCMLCWAFFVPVALILMMHVSHREYVEYGYKIYHFSNERMENLSQLLSVTPVLALVFGTIASLVIAFVRGCRTCSQDLRTILKPSKHWGPLTEDTTVDGVEMQTNTLQTSPSEADSTA